MDEKRDRYAGKHWVSREEKQSTEQRDGQYRRQDGRGDRGFSRDGQFRKNGDKKPYRENGRDRGGDESQRSFVKGDRWKENRDSRDNRDGDAYRSRERAQGGGKPFRGPDRAGKDRPREFEKSEKPAENTQPPQQTGGEDELPFLIIGRNAVREAIKSGRSIDRVLVVTERDGSLNEIVSMARDAKLLLRETDRKKLDELCMPFGHGGKTANHQGIVAYAAGMEYCSVQDILNVAKEKNEDPFVIVLDGVEDPHNLGSIIRSAECAGAHGVIIGKRRSASVTASAVKAAAGATAYMKVARVVNISGALEELKRAGLWVAGADMDGIPMHKQGMNGPLAIVIGGEGGGLTKLVRETCDFLISIPMKGQINSLNASVAAAILMFEKNRQDAEPAE